MTNNTKQSEETYIRWSVNMNSAINVGQIEPEPILTIHPDGRVTTSPRLKPDEISALVLDQIKTAWLKDSQATKIRELETELERTKQERNAIAKNTREPLLLKLDEANARIKRLEEFVEQLTNPKFTSDDLPKEALLQRIKRLEEAGDAMMSEPCEYTFDQWLKAKEAKA